MRLQKTTPILLCALITFLLAIAVSDVCAQSKDISHGLTPEEVMHQLPEAASGADSERSQNNPFKPLPELRVFVSSAMPKAKLRAYCKEAARFNASLIFRGLPQGSFLHLNYLIMDINDDAASPCPVQIDDAAFNRFAVRSVPAIVLSRQDELLLCKAML